MSTLVGDKFKATVPFVVAGQPAILESIILDLSLAFHYSFCLARNWSNTIQDTLMIDSRIINL